VLTKGITATDAEVKAFYKKNSDPSNKQAVFYTPETIQMAVIVTPTEAEARAALRDLDSGIPFTTVAQNRSKDPSKVSGGMLNPVPRGRTKSSEIPWNGVRDLRPQGRRASWPPSICRDLVDHPVYR
jgi:parvulin-like peptidyl-prolyl isomerase